MNRTVNEQPESSATRQRVETVRLTAVGKVFVRTEEDVAAVTDVSFISLRLILPAIDRLLRPGGETVALIKPQFEAGRHDVGKGGVVRNAATRQKVVERIREFGCITLGWEWLGICQSPIQGRAGNIEFLSYWRKPS